MADALRSGHLSPDKLRAELSHSAPMEMRKGADRLIKEGKTPSVDLLMAEYDQELEFQSLAEKVGLDREYFMDLAEAELKRRSA